MSHNKCQNQSLSNKFQIGQADYSPVFRPSCTSKTVSKTKGTIMDDNSSKSLTKVDGTYNKSQRSKGTVMDDNSSKSSSKLDQNCNKTINDDDMANINTNDNSNSISSKPNFRKLHNGYYENWHKKPLEGEPRPMRLIEFIRNYSNSRPVRQTREMKKYIEELKKKREDKKKHIEEL